MLANIFNPQELEAIKSHLFPYNDDLANLDPLKEKGVVVFGAGLHGRHAVDQLLQAGVVPHWIVDNSPLLQNTTFRDIAIRPLQSLGDLGARYVLLTSGHMLSMYNDCQKYGVKTYLVPMNLPILFNAGSTIGWRWAEADGNQELEKLLAVLADEPSRQVLKNYIAYQLTLDNKYFAGCGPEDMYFPAGVPINTTHYLDAGAFDGDTLRDWASRMVKTHPVAELQYMAFEPGLDNYKLLEKTVKTLPLDLQPNISIYNYGLGAKNETVTFSAELCLDTASDQQVEIVTIDSLVSDYVPTIIKADIEGYELNMLEGARKTLAKHKPSLAISVYHRRNDLFDIPNWIRSLDLGYKIYLRHHRPVVTDTVCYAVAD